MLYKSTPTGIVNMMLSADKSYQTRYRLGLKHFTTNQANKNEPLGPLLGFSFLVPSQDGSDSNWPSLTVTLLRLS
ncbi:hypothetical protein QQ41_08230 [Streptococcus equi subsp. zooepidemicus]|nr:hypothetical protein QQ41_08230 [Streptococcus equi subsp. zooepidemicus]